MGLLESDEEWETCLLEASQTITNTSILRELFGIILIQCQPNSPQLLWNKFKNKLSEDILFDLKKNI